mmetsp:Transcript_26175/g.47175  ORF Transcript_26175/g.47175 Transcript_26175/m.47175 type:complete len:249 (-) Transcript_26175:1206-1952(-)
MMWNLTENPFPPSPCHPASPGPMNYSPKPLNLSHSFSMAHAVRREAHTTNLEAPGPGAYSSTDLVDPFTVYGPPLSPTMPPSLKRCPALPKSPRNIHPLGHGVLGETGDVINGNLVRSGVPGPQAYSPKAEAVLPRNLLGACQSQGHRFDKDGDERAPGPGSYPYVEKPGREAYTTPKLYKRHRALEETIADYKILKHERKLPGPGYYDAQQNGKGKSASSFKGVPPSSAFVVSLDELYGGRQAAFGV